MPRFMTWIGCCCNMVRLAYTGHRANALTSADQDLIVEGLATLLAGFEREANPGVLAGSLATGADSWVAQIGSKRGWKLDVCLPCPVADFPDVQGLTLAKRCEFAHLMEQADAVTALPGPPDYLAAGLRSLVGADALVSIWNGDPGRGAGGTADLIAHALSHGITTYWIDLEGNLRLLRNPTDLEIPPAIPILQSSKSQL